MEKLSTEYGKKPNLSFSIYPAPQVISVVITIKLYLNEETWNP